MEKSERFYCEAVGTLKKVLVLFCLVHVSLFFYNILFSIVNLEYEASVYVYKTEYYLIVFSRYSLLLGVSYKDFQVVVFIVSC